MFVASARSFLTLRNSAFKRWIVLLDSSLMTALFLISLALCANINVDSDSPAHCYAGVTFAMITVLLLPPRESLSKKVSLLSL